MLSNQHWLQIGLQECGEINFVRWKFKNSVKHLMQDHSIRYRRNYHDRNWPCLICYTFFRQSLMEYTGKCGTFMDLYCQKDYSKSCDHELNWLCAPFFNYKPEDKSPIILDFVQSIIFYGDIHYYCHWLVSLSNCTGINTNFFLWYTLKHSNKNGTELSLDRDLKCIQLGQQSGAF